MEIGLIGNAKRAVAGMVWWIILYAWSAASVLWAIEPAISVSRLILQLLVAGCIYLAFSGANRPRDIMGYRALPSKFLHPSWWRIAGREFIAEKAAAIAFRSEVIDLNVEGTSLRFQIGDPTGASWYKKDGLDNEDIRHIETYLLAEDGSSIVFEIGCHHARNHPTLARALERYAR